jgi:hypothetical protein
MFLLGFISSLPQLAWEKDSVAVVDDDAALLDRTKTEKSIYTRTSEQVLTAMLVPRCA